MQDSKQVKSWSQTISYEALTYLEQQDAHSIVSIQQTLDSLFHYATMGKTVFITDCDRIMGFMKRADYMDLAGFL